MIRLPVSGIEVVLRPLTGMEELLLLETPSVGVGYAPSEAIALTLALLGRLARSIDGAALEWSAFAVTDLDALLLRVRQACFGDLLCAETLCPAEGCGARIDVAFRIDAYLDHHAPRAPRRVAPDSEAGWFRFTDAPLRFRIPTGADQMAAARQPDPERALILRCVRPTSLPASLPTSLTASLTTRGLRRVENALECLAPGLSGTLQGSCPECGATVDIAFHPGQFTLRELREQAAFVYEDVHLLASHYHWSEADILALPCTRRTAYAELLRQQRSRC